MDDKIKQVLDLIQTYRQGELFVNINENHVGTWIQQFDEDDREFILSELIHIMPKSYISKEKALDVLNSVFEVLAKDFKYDTVEELLDHTCFLHCQEHPKSQSILLNLLDELIVAKYGRTVNDCGSKEIKYWIYLDDVLASGGTFRRDIIKVISEFGKEEFKESGISIINVFFILHEWGYNNSKYAIEKAIDYKLDKSRLKFYRIETIENNPRLHSYWNPKPKFNHVYPLESDEGKEFLEFIEGAFERTYSMSNEQFAFRDTEHPKTEEFYSNSENRNRYEAIMLKKGIEIINKIENLNAKGLRPLGMTSPSYKTLGTGSHFFTWRNISNTCPLVFWWESNGWHPLFPVKNRGKN